MGNGSTLYYLVNVTDTEEESVVLLQHTVNSTVLQLRVAELLPNHVHQVSVAAVSGEETGPAVTVRIKTSAVTAAGKYVMSEVKEVYTSLHKCSHLQIMPLQELPQLFNID